MRHCNIACTLCLVSISPATAKAETVDEQELLESYLTNSDVSEEQIAETDRLVEERFYDKLYRDEYGHLYLDTSDVDETDDFDVATAQMIEQNLAAMNAMVDEGVAYIDDSYELVVIGDDDFLQQWSAWGFKLSWNKVTVNMDKDYAILFSSICLVVNVVTISYNIKNLAKNISDKNGMKDVLYAALNVLPSDISRYIVAFFTNDAIATLLETLCAAVQLLISSNPIVTVLSIVLSYIVPGLVDSVVVLYNACRYNKGMYVKFCWLPWFGDHWGLTIKSL